jgi:hypothetical protein
MCCFFFIYRNFIFSSLFVVQKQFYKYKEVEKHDGKLSLNAKDMLREDQNGNKPPPPQWVKNNTVKYLVSLVCLWHENKALLISF